MEGFISQFLETVAGHALAPSTLTHYEFCATPFINHPLPTKESVFRTELAKLDLPDSGATHRLSIAANRVALATRNEKLLALRGDFDALTMDFWGSFRARSWVRGS